MAIKQLNAIRLTLYLGTLLGFWFSLPIWTSDRAFPQLPLFDFLPLIQHPIDKILFCIELFLLTTACFFKKNKTATIILVLWTVLIVILDQNRIQPWLYIYYVLLFLINFGYFDEARYYFASIYIWSGIQKLNFHFLTSYFANHLLPEINLFQYGLPVVFSVSLLASLLEISAGYLLWKKKGTGFALTFLTLMHTLIFLKLSPLGFNNDKIVWPWGFTMIALAFFLFKNAQSSRKKVHPLFATFLMLPILFFFDLWDSQLSYTFYSGNTAAGIYKFNPEYIGQLPDEAKKYLKNLDKPKSTLYIDNWTFNSFNCPFNPEPRLYKLFLKRLCLMGIPDATLILSKNPNPLNGAVAKEKISCPTD